MSSGTDSGSFPPTGPEPTQRTPERVILAAACFERRGRERAEEHLNELESLARTAGGDVVERHVLERRRPDPSSYIGQGQAEMLAGRVRELHADLVIFDDDLSPGQVRELERILQARVIDRSGLILDIFSGRARTREARTQVQVAQLEYLLPRLAGRWLHLSRQRGGIIGMRGVGETQIEIDRRLVRRKLGHLKQELLRIEAGRQQRREARDGLPRVAVVGYTNAGKSSLVNALAGADCIVEDRLFSTLDPRVRGVDLAPHVRVLLVDTVGFLRKLPHHLIASFRSTLEEAAGADLLLHVVDVSHAAFEEHMRVTRETILELGAGDCPEIVVFNKTDLLHGSGSRERLHSLYPGALWASAAQSWGIEEVRACLHRALIEERPLRRVSLPAARQDLVHRVYELVQVTAQRYRRDRVLLHYRATLGQEGRLRRTLERGRETAGASA